ncbi:MAG: hypothetical protein IE916_03745 [Epsilonproteobacteria bacterium]|nr:hypothetical protein [Campylobacterota bacterium]
MRNASVAIVPLLLAIFVLFWFILFMGSENENLKQINNLEHLEHLQERLLVAAVKRRYELLNADPNMSEDELETLVNEYIHSMMKLNKIDD